MSGGKPLKVSNQPRSDRHGEGGIDERSRRGIDPCSRLEPGQLLPAALLPGICRGGHADQRVRRGRSLPAPARQRPRARQPDQEGGRRPPHPQRRAQFPEARDHRQARRPRGRGQSDPARGDQAVRGAQGRQRRAHLLGERRRPALRQGLLVEEAFEVTVASGVLYYVGSKTRVDVPLGPALREATLAAIDRIRDLSSRETPPEPLPPELRHRCFGCSLATICLPEETLYSIQHSGPGPSRRHSLRSRSARSPPGSRSPASSP